MRAPLFILLFLMAFLAHASAGVVISEFLASNDTGIKDEDGDQKDWIEIYNNGSAAVNLGGWHLTDDDADLTKWTFPSVLIPADGYLIVWASKKDRNDPGKELHTNFSLKSAGEYLALVQSDGSTVEHEFAPKFPTQVADVSYGLSAGVVATTVIQQGSAGRAGAPTSESDFNSHYSGWNTDVAGAFTSSGWRSVQSGVGYDTNATYGGWIGSGGDFQTELYNNLTSLYLRVKFNIDDPSLVSGLKLRMRWDDGMVAYINGVEVARDSAPVSPTWDSVGVNREDDLNESWTTFSVDLSQVTLNAGENLLAIHGMNTRVGSSDMLILPELDVLIPAESSEYLYFTTPTPGMPNEAGSTDLPPLVSDVTESLAVLPTGGSGSVPIYVHARVSKTMHDVDSVQLYYRKMFDGESSVTMLDNGANGDQFAGDGIFTAQIPTTQMEAGQMMRWRVVATDTEGAAMRAPLFADSNDSDEYFGTIAADPSITTSNLHVLHWFVENPSAANTRDGTRGACYFLGGFYDNIQTDLHGQTSAGFPKKSYDFDFNKGNRFKWKDGEGKVKDFNLLTNWADKAKMRNALSYEIIQRTGMISHYDQQVRVQQNAVFFSTADMVEDGDDRFLERVGLDGEGALYKMYDTLSSTSKGSKQTRKDEDKSDLQALINGLNPAQALSEIRRYGYDAVDIPGTISYLAARALIHDDDHQHKNYYVYRDTLGNGEWSPLVWDVDLSWGRNWTSYNSYLNDVMYYDNSLVQKHAGQSKGDNRLYELVFDSPELRAMYLRRLRTLMDTILQAPGTLASELVLEQRVDEICDLIDPVGITSDADLDYSKWGSWGNQNQMRAAADRIKNEHLPNRRDFLFNQDPTLQGTSIPSPQVSQPSITIEPELEYNPVSGNQGEEYFILKNRTAVAVDISGWTISGAVEMTFKGGTVIPAEAGDSASEYIGLLHVTRDVTAFRSRSTGPTGGELRFIQGGYDGQLSARGETIELRDAEGNLVDFRSYSGDSTPAQDALRVCEINYHPTDPTAAELISLPGVSASDFEWIELINIGVDDLDLAGAAFTEGIDYTFAAGATLAAGQRMILVKNTVAFALRNGVLSNVLGPYSGKLNNGGERLQITDVTGENILDFSWNDKWYPPSAGVGRTLVIRDTNIAFDDYDEPSSWGIGASDHGSPGALDPKYYVHFEGWRYEKFNSVERADPQTGMVDSDPDGDGLSNWAEYCYGLNPRTLDQIDVSQLRVNPGDGDYVAIEFTRRRDAYDIGWSMRSSDDLSSWFEETSVMHGASPSAGAGLEKVILRSSTQMNLGGKKFFRMQGIRQ